jgi:hypothetical protein
MPTGLDSSHDWRKIGYLYRYSIVTLFGRDFVCDVVELLLGQESTVHQRVRVPVGTPLHDVMGLADADSGQ